MTSRDFCYWLQGYFEIALAHGENTAVLSSVQIDLIKRHLAMVFKHEIDPSYGDAAHQAVLSEIHDTPFCAAPVTGDSTASLSAKPPLHGITNPPPNWNPHGHPQARC